MYYQINPVSELGTHMGLLCYNNATIPARYYESSQMIDKAHSSPSRQGITQLIDHINDSPLTFLHEQHKYFISGSSETHSTTSSTDIDVSSYARDKKYPRILNITLGRNTAVANKGTYIELVIENVQALKSIEFDADIFLVIRLDDILQYLSPEEIIDLLSECRRILDQHGQLHLRVPGAKKAIHDISKGHIADIKTLFSPALLEHFFEQTGFEDTKYTSTLIDFTNKSYRAGDTDTTDYAVYTGHKKLPHDIDNPLGDKDFMKKCQIFKDTHLAVPDASFVITIYNEANNLPHFLSFLEAIKNETGMRREFIFVLNGCTDESENILHTFLNQTALKAKVITSLEKGILPAFKEGMRNRDYDGFVGRFDADIFLHPHTLDLMQMHLAENKLAQVTYAEPLSMDSPSAYNEPWYNPNILSKRLYYTGKTSLYRENPHVREDIRDMPSNLIADDIFTSFYLTYFYGLGSISRTPHALVYEKVVNNFDDLVNQQSRCDSEITRILDAYPHFNNLNGLTVQEVFPSAYLDLINKTKEKSTYVEDWIRLESTK